MALLRDGHGEPIRKLVTRDRGGRFVTPRYRFLWELQAGPEPSPRESQAAAVLGDIEAG
jgi:hypothetical protein